MTLEAGPFVDLHLHLLGALPRHGFIQLLRRHKQADLIELIPPKILRAMRRRERFRSLFSSTHWHEFDAQDFFLYESSADFMLTYYFVLKLIQNQEDFACLVRWVLSDLSMQGIKHAELIVSLPAYIENGLSLTECMNTLADEKAKSTLSISWLLDPIRDRGPDTAHSLLELVLNHDESVFTGLHLGGNEGSHSTACFRPVYDLARSQGLHLAVHAGEMKGARSIWEAIDVLGVERIGHGIRATEDEKLLQRLQYDRIPLEICLSSNIQTHLTASLHTHPVKRLLEESIPIVLCTDDPSFFSTNLASEYLMLKKLHPHPEALEAIQRDSIEYAFLANQAKQRLRSCLL